MANPVRVLVFYQYFTTRAGSWSTRYYEFAKRWVEAGAEVTIVTSSYDKSDLRGTGWRRHEICEGIQVVVLGGAVSSAHGFQRRVLGFLHYAIVATWYALTRPADVVIASSGPITVGIPGLAARVLRGRKLVFEVRDLWPQGAIELGVLRPGILASLAYAFARWCYRASSRVIACSEGMRDGVFAEEHTAQITVIPNASDTDLFAPAPVAAHPPFVIYAGSLGRMDDGHALVDLAAELARRGRGEILVRVYGTGPDREAIRARGELLGLTNLRIEGLVSKEELARILPRAVAALVLFRPGPVMDTVSPNKLFDALAAGVPVIQTTEGWIRQLLAVAEAGLTVPSGDIQAMSEAVLALADDATRRERMGRAARNLAETRFSREQLAAQYFQVLWEVARGRGYSISSP